MSLSLYLAAALFLPLFPLSMGFNQLFARVRHPAARGALLLLWPQLGIVLIAQADVPPPAWFVAWSVLSALFYAYRAIALREVGLWIGFVATSAWALLWVGGAEIDLLHLQALGLSLPLVLVALLAGDLERRFGAVHARLNLSLAAVAPRAAGLFVVAVLAAVATPLFPNFFTLVGVIAQHGHSAPAVAFAMAATWVLWSWSGARLLQGVVVGNGPQGELADASGARDLSAAHTWAYVIGFVALAIGGIQFAGALA